MLKPGARHDDDRFRLFRISRRLIFFPVFARRGDVGESILPTHTMTAHEFVCVCGVCVRCAKHGTYESELLEGRPRAMAGENPSIGGGDSTPAPDDGDDVGDDAGPELGEGTASRPAASGDGSTLTSPDDRASTDLRRMEGPRGDGTGESAGELEASGEAPGGVVPKPIEGRAGEEEVRRGEAVVARGISAVESEQERVDGDEERAGIVLDGSGLPWFRLN
jgi:hypothetical protein